MVEDLSDLPRDNTRSDKESVGVPPDTNPNFIMPLVEAWWEAYRVKEGGGLAHSVPGTKFRASMAGSCARKLAYYMAGAQESDPVTVADAYRFEIGHFVHEAFQKWYEQTYPDAQVELDIDYRGGRLNLDGSAHADLFTVIDEEQAAKEGIEPGKYLIEIKTINGYAYKVAATSFKYSPPGGPKHNAFLQACLSAVQMDADFVTLCYLSLENLSPKLALAVGAGDEVGRFAAQWTFSRDEFEDMAFMERDRIAGIIDMIEPYTPEGAEAIGTPVELAKTVPRQLVDPDVPAGAVIINPGTSTWQKVEKGHVVDTGQAWHGNYCNYCNYQTRCAVDG